MTAHQPTYHHISKFTPKLKERVSSQALPSIPKALVWRTSVAPDKENDSVATELCYAQGSNIYELECSLPFNTFHENGEGTEKPTDLYDNAFKNVGKEPLTPKWVYQGENVSKMIALDNGENNLIAMSSNGSLAWFRDGIKVPVEVLQEIMGPSTSYSGIHSLKRGPDDLAVADFAVSVDGDTVIKSQSSSGQEAGGSIFKIIDNYSRIGEVLRTVSIPETTLTHTVRFFNNTLMATCSDDNVMRFWDIRTADKPLWVLRESQNGLVTSFDASTLTESLFVTGSSTGVIKLWDARAVRAATMDLTHRQNGEDPCQKELAMLYHSGGDSVVDVQFAETASSEFLTVGGSGSIYQWDMEYFFSKNDDDNADDGDVAMSDRNDLQGECLKFFHRDTSLSAYAGTRHRYTVASHPLVDNMVAYVRPDSNITVYKPYVKRDSISQSA